MTEYRRVVCGKLLTVLHHATSPQDVVRPEGIAAAAVMHVFSGKRSTRPDTNQQAPLTVCISCWYRADETVRSTG